MIGAYDVLGCTSGYGAALMENDDATRSSRQEQHESSTCWCQWMDHSSVDDLIFETPACSAQLSLSLARTSSPSLQGHGGG